jgi:hypothetical protein
MCHRYPFLGCRPDFPLDLAPRVQRICARSCQCPVPQITWLSLRSKWAAGPAAAHGRQPKDVAADGAYARPLRGGDRIGYVPSLGPRTGAIARQAQTRELPRLPLRVERPKDAFNPSLLNVRLVQGASRAGGRSASSVESLCGGRIASYLTSYQQTVCLRRHPIDLKKRNATPRSGWWLRVNLLLRCLS